MELTIQVKQIKLMVIQTIQLFRIFLFNKGFLQEQPPLAEIEDILTTDMLCDCRHVAKIVALAFQNRSK